MKDYSDSKLFFICVLLLGAEFCKMISSKITLDSLIFSGLKLSAFSNYSTLLRLNHSCCPNTEFFWNSEKKVEELRATHPLPAGTELTDCYIDFPVEGRLVRRDRRVLLRVGFGFWCSCQVCDQPGEISIKDDELRKEAWDLSLIRLELHVTDDPEELSHMLGKEIF